jgi:hypothetical protein
VRSWPLSDKAGAREKRSKPNHAKIKNGLAHPPWRKKLRLAMAARIMMNRNFSKNRASGAKLVNQFDAYCATGFAQDYLLDR